MISAIDKGFAAISPATIGFRDADCKKLEELTKDMNAIYIINDNETNGAGYEGALKTGKSLAMAGRNVYLVSYKLLSQRHIFKYQIFF